MKSVMNSGIFILQEKINEIFNSQLTDEKFRKACRVVIDNNGTIEAAEAQIEAALMLPHSM